MRKSLRKYLKWDHDSGNDDDNINGKSYFFSCSPGTNTSLSLATLSPWFTHSEFRIFISVDINHHLPRIYLILIAFWVLLENINHLHFFSCRLISYKTASEIGDTFSRFIQLTMSIKKFMLFVHLIWFSNQNLKTTQKETIINQHRISIAWYAISIFNRLLT